MKNKPYWNGSQYLFRLAGLTFSIGSIENSILPPSKYGKFVLFPSVIFDSGNVSFDTLLDGKKHLESVAIPESLRWDGRKYKISENITVARIVHATGAAFKKNFNHLMKYEDNWVVLISHLNGQEALSFPSLDDAVVGTEDFFKMRKSNLAQISADISEIKAELSKIRELAESLNQMYLDAEMRKDGKLLEKRRSIASLLYERIKKYIGRGLIVEEFRIVEVNTGDVAATVVEDLKIIVYPNNPRKMCEFDEYNKAAFYMLENHW